MRNQKHLHQSFCFKKGIKIYLQPITNTSGRIDVKFEGTFIEGKVIFNISKKRKKTDPKWEDAIWEGYKFYYNKLKTEENE